MTSRNRGRLARLEIGEAIREEPLGPILEVLVVTHEEAAHSRELDELLRSSRAYIDDDQLPKKAEGESIRFSEILAAVVHVPEEDVVERAGVTEHRKRMFV